MFKHIHGLLLGTIVLSTVTDMSYATPTCETTFTGSSPGQWDDGASWSSGAPTSTKVACIPHDKTVIVDVANAAAEAIWVKKSGGTQGKLILLDTNATDLKVYGDSRVDGVIEIEDRGVLRFMANLVTVEGDGGRIQGMAAGAKIQGANGGDNGGTKLVLSGDGVTRSTSIMVHGVLVIQTPVFNKSAFVVADNSTLTILYDTDTRTCDADGGQWVAEQHATDLTIGTLYVGNTVYGSGVWVLTSHADASIYIAADCDGNSGAVSVQKGTFIVTGTNIEFVTSGRLDFESVGGSAPQIIVEGTCYARFDN